MKVARRKDGKAWTPSACAILLLMLGVGAWVQRQPLLDIVQIGLKDEELTHIL